MYYLLKISLRYNLSVLVLFTLYAICLYGCTTSAKTVSQTELKHYVIQPEHGLIKEVANDKLALTVTLRPTDLLVAQELKAIDKPTAEDLDKAEAGYAGFIYFNLTMSENNQDITNTYAGDKRTFERVIKCLSFEMNKYVELVTSAGDTIPVADYSYPRAYGTTGNTQLQFVFNKEKIDNSSYIDFCMSNIPDLNINACKIRFNTSDIKKTPHINFKSSNHEI